MIIDCHTRLWSDPRQLGPEAAAVLSKGTPSTWALESGDAAAHGREMSCTDIAFVLGLRADLVGAHVPNELIAEFVGRDPQRRVGIAGIDPLAQSTEDDIKAALQLGMSGITVSPALAGIHPTHSAAMKVYELCCSHSLPIIVTMPNPIPASAILDFARPVHWDEVARTYPKLRILFTQMGYPWIDELLVLADKHENVYAEVSGVATRPWQLYNALSTASSLGVMDKLMFGSGFPLSTPQQAIESLYSVNRSVKGTPLPSVSRSLVKEIVERDALKCLGIPMSLSGKTTSRMNSDTPSFNPSTHATK